MTLSASGVNVKAAVAKASAWGAAVACGADSGVLIKPHTLKRTRQSLIDDSLGLYFPQSAVNAQIKVEGDIPSYLRYDGLDLLIALAMGETGGLPAGQGATTAYAQTFSLANTLDTYFATFIVNNGVNIDEYTTVKITGFTLTGEVGKPWEIKFHAIAIDRITGSTVNTPTTFNNVTFFETGARVLFGQSVFWMGNNSGSALSFSNAIFPNKFELQFKRKMAGKYGTGTSMDLIDEPTNDGLPEITLKLTMPRYTAATYFNNWDPMTQQMLQMTATGANIASTYNRSFQIQFPALQLSNVDLPMKEGILEHPLEFKALSIGTDPAGMTGVTNPFAINVVNRQSVNVLA